MPTIKERSAQKFLKWLGQESPSLYTITPGENKGNPLLRDPKCNLRSLLEEYKNTYFSLAVPRSGMFCKAGKEDLLGTHFLHIDLDPQAGTDFNTEYNRIFLSVTDQRPASVPKPSALITSGRGVQAIWRLKTPQKLPECEQAVENANRWLIKVLGGDKGTHNVDRVLRLPGSWNCLTEKKIAKGWEPAEAKLLEVNDLSYELTDFGEVTEGTGKALDGGYAPRVECDAEWTDDLGALREKYGVPMRVTQLVSKGHPGTWLSDYVLDHGECKRDPNNRSDWVFDVCCNLHRFRVPEAVILGLMLDSKWAISQHCLDQANPEQSARRQVSRCQKFVEESGGVNPLPGAAPSESSNQAQAGQGGSGDGEPPRKPRPAFTIPVGKTAPDACRHNIMLCLDWLEIELAHDLFAGVDTIKGMGNGLDGMISDSAVRRLWWWIDEEFHLQMPEARFSSLVMDTCRNNAHHPVKEWFKQLPEWDGKNRLDTWLLDYAGVSPDPDQHEYTRAIGRISLIAAVRRIMQPGCAYQEVLTFISPQQGTGKSTLIKTLCGKDEWFTSDFPLAADSKTTIERLKGHWIVELGEVEGMRRAKEDHIKNLISRGTDVARMAFGRVTTHQPRANIFMATTNNPQFLSDPTGNRRWWPVHVGEIDLRGLRKVLKQLWAEVLVAERAGESITLPRDLWASAGAMQQETTAVDRWHEIIDDAIGENKYGKITCDDVWKLLEGATANNKSALDNTRLTVIMRNLGWKKWKSKLEARGRQNESLGKKSCFVKMRYGVSDVKALRWIHVDRDYSRHGTQTIVRTEIVPEVQAF